MMDYFDWNNRLATHFFSSSKAGCKVHLFATSELIVNIGQSSGEGFKDYLSAVKLGPICALKKEGVCNKALQTMSNWRLSKWEYPPYIAYLALFVMAAGLEGEFVPHAYYPRLRTLLGEMPFPGTYPGFEHMLELWNDLERWSSVDRLGELGEFQVRVQGSWIHCGVPIAQTLLSEEERNGLATVFAMLGLDSAAPPSDEEMASLFLRYGKNFLRQRTLSRLKSNVENDADTRRALIERLLDELHEWDGEMIGSKDDHSSHERTYFSGTLRLFCKLDRTAREAELVLRW